MLAGEFGANDKWLGGNLIAYHQYIRENDLCMTHAFGHPQVNRGAALSAQPAPSIATGIVAELIFPYRSTFTNTFSMGSPA